MSLPNFRLFRGYLRFYFRGRDGCRPGRLLFDLRLIGKSYGLSRDGRAAATAAAAAAAAAAANASLPSLRLGGVHTTNAAGRILNHKFMAPRALLAARRPSYRAGKACVALLQRHMLFITRLCLSISFPPVVLCPIRSSVQSCSRRSRMQLIFSSRTECEFSYSHAG